MALASEPTGPVNVTLMVTQGDDALGPIIERLTFSASGIADKWDIPQDVRLRPVDNNYKNSDVSVTIEHTASGGDYDGVTSDYVLTIEDDESPSEFVNVSANITDVAEDSGSRVVTLTVELDGSPFAAETLVSLSIAGTALIGADFLSAHIISGDISGDNVDLASNDVTVVMPAGMSITKVRLELALTSDRIDEGDDETIIISGSGVGLESGEKATIRINDNDTAGISLSKTSLEVAEGGAGVTYTVRLNSQPIGSVKVSLKVEGPGKEIISPTPDDLTFTDRNWEKPQTVTVSARDDDERNSDLRELTITNTAESLENIEYSDGYHSSDPESDRVKQISLDLIEHSVLISPQAAIVGEDENTDYGVRLTSEPTSPVTVTVTILDEIRREIEYLQLNVNRMEVGQGRTLTLTFDDRNWKAYQTVTIQTVNNNYSGMNPLVVIEHTVSSFGDYAGVTAGNFSLTITDDEEAAESILLILDPSTVEESEDSSAGSTRVELKAKLVGLTAQRGDDNDTSHQRLQQQHLPGYLG